MRLLSTTRAFLGSLLLLAGCGSRTGLLSAQAQGGGGAGGGGAGGSAGAPPVPEPVPECVTAKDCPQPEAQQCGAASCEGGVCVLEVVATCDDGDPCTMDTCTAGVCGSEDGRIDADGDGAFATGTARDPRALLGCGTDCDDSSASVFPGAAERCDGLDNDCNGVKDDRLELVPSGLAPTRVSALDVPRSEGASLAFDGEAFGATFTSFVGGRAQGQFQRIDLRARLVGEPQRIARVNAESYGGPLAWSGERFFTAYEDARQDTNYEIYFNQLNREGRRIAEDLRVTDAVDYSLRPTLLWTGSEALLVWDDRRFEAAGDASTLFGQRISGEGALVGGNVRLSPEGVRAENAATALGTSRVGIAFIELGVRDLARLSFMTTSLTLQEPSSPITIPFEEPNDPVVTALNGGFVITFHQHAGNAIGPSIYGVSVSEKGEMLGAVQPLTTGAPHARGNATFSYGDRFVMVWSDDREGNYQLYAQTFDKSLSPISTPQRLTATRSTAWTPFVAGAADGGLGVLYKDESAGQSQTLFTRLNCVSPVQ